jgi:ketosteroid isomerase-like protein
MIALLLVAAPAWGATAQESAHSSATAIQLSPAVRDATAVVDAFHRALHDGNQDAAAALVADDALIYESGRAERSKAEYASHHLPADTAFAAATTRAVSRRSGHAVGDLAWVATESATTGTFKDRPIDSRSTETMILRRENGAWRIAHIHWSSANVK